MLFIFCLLILRCLLSITSCPLTSVDIQSGCFCGIEVDGSNYIHCRPHTIDVMPRFTRSYVHEKLNLSHNFLRYLTDQSFEQLKVKRIYLDDNPLESISRHSFDQNLLNYLEELSLQSATNLTIEFLCFGQWNKLRRLRLIGFDLQQFQWCFEKLPRLEQLSIEQSSIDVISSSIWELPLLWELSLINNRLISLQWNSSRATSIRSLNLTSNQLHFLPPTLHTQMPQLNTLDLSFNQFESIPQLPSSSFNLNLSFNSIRHVELVSSFSSLDLSSNPICTLERTTTTTSLVNVTIDGLNHLHCDCRLGYFLWERNSTNENPFNNETRCSTPSIFKGALLIDLTPEELFHTCSTELPDHCEELKNFPSNRYSSFRLISFETIFDQNDLIIQWKFDVNALVNDPRKVSFQILVEQESTGETIRRTDFLSPFLSEHRIDHLTSNRNYQVCLLLTRSSYGTDKYCRETRRSSNETFSSSSLIHRSILCGFLIGTLVTTVLLTSLAFVFRFYVQQRQGRWKSSSYVNDPTAQRYMYIDGTYSHSIVSLSSSKCRAYPSHSSDYREPITTSSVMSSSTWNDFDRTKHVYEELIEK